MSALCRALRAGPKTTRIVNRRGSVLLVAVFALTVLMGAAALTVDVGKMLTLASHAQGLADAAALSAAGDTITNHPDEVIVRIQEVLDANARPNVAVRWTPDENQYYVVGNTIPGYGMVSYGQEAVSVTVHIDTSYLFGRVLGLSTGTVTRSATALRQVGGGGNSAFFAICPDPSVVGINISGNSVRMNGRIHSNTRIDISGNKDHFTDRVEWVNRFRVTGKGNIFDIGDFSDEVIPPPATYTPEMFGQPTYEVFGDYNVSGNTTVPPGTYRVHGDVHVSGKNNRLVGVTFIADGQVQFSGSNQLYTPDRLNVFAYSLYNGAAAIDISGAAPGCYGTLYAPQGQIDFASSGMIITNSSIIGWTIDLSGQDFTISPTPEIGGGKTVARLVR